LVYRPYDGALIIFYSKKQIRQNKAIHNLLFIV
jgi:hypothetical protein